MKSGLIFLLLVAGSVASAQRTSTFDFLRLDMNARAAALNGSFVSMTNDPNLLYYNPAGLATLEHPSASASFLKHLLDVNAGSLTYGQEFPDLGTFAAGIIFVDYGSFQQTDESMNALGTFSAREIALSMGWGTALEENMYIGASIEFISSSIAGFSANAAAIGAGILYQIPSEMITIGASLLHAGTQIGTYAGIRESLPLELTLGITKKPEHLPAYLNLNFHKLTDRADSFLDRFGSFSIGVEFLMSESTRLRAGYDNEKKRELKLGTGSGLAGFSFGGGILVKEYQIDYSFNSYGKIGGLHRVSVGMTLEP
ncbi:MAG: type IX secretion system protein PorQ [Bacteroidota bacterium]